jgi:hypothetical protein
MPTDTAEAVFDGAMLLNASQLQPVTNATVKAILNPSARGKVLVMPLKSSPSSLLWDGVPLTPSTWPNTGLAYVRRVYDAGAVYCQGRTKGPPPHYSMADPIGGNISLASLPTGDWAAEMAAGEVTVLSNGSK